MNILIVVPEMTNNPFHVEKYKLWLIQNIKKSFWGVKTGHGI